MCPSHTYDELIRNHYDQCMYLLVQHAPANKGHDDYYGQSVVGMPALTEMDEVKAQSGADNDSWFIATYHAPAPILRYWLVPASFASVFHYGPSSFTVPDPPISMIQ